MCNTVFIAFFFLFKSIPLPPPLLTEVLKGEKEERRRKRKINLKQAIH